MCGIGGLYSVKTSDISDEEFYRFIDSIAHRGPDGKGVWKDALEPLFLGHRRLKILDLSAKGFQPMPSESGRYRIVFNGEIYNFLELKKELQTKGYSFRSDSDTEVILAAYAHWGEACQDKLNGMWGFAIWDTQEKSLFLSRDRFGVKPLFYFYDGKRFAFGSELKQFLFLPGFSFEIDEQALSDSLYRSGCLEATETTWLKNVYRLPAGCSATFHRLRGLKVTRWWNTLDHLGVAPKTFEEQVETFRILFFDACRLRLRSDVPLGAALSGGLDSSSVVSSIVKIGRQENLGRLPRDWQKVFTATYPGTLQDEEKFAKEVIAATQTEAHFVEINAREVLDHLDETLFQFEEVFDLPIGPWLLYRRFRERNTVISIDGHGADELLGGYHQNVEQAMSFHLLHRRRFGELKEILTHLYPEGASYPLPTSGSILKKMLKNKVRRTPLLYQSARTIYRLLKGSHLPAGIGWLKIEPKLSLQEPEFAHDRRFQKMSAYNRMLFDSFHHASLPMILRNFDRASMAHGIEVRAPFMDYRLVLFCMSLPEESKLGGGYTKRILREAMKGIVPESIRTRRCKIGFANPIVEWVGGGLKPFILDSVNSLSFLSSSIWDGPAIRDFVEQGYRRSDYQGVRRSWEFIQTNHLIELFKNAQLQNTTR